MNKKTIPLTCNQIFWLLMASLSIIAITGHYYTWELDYFVSQGGIFAPMAILGSVGLILGLGIRTLIYITDHYKCKCDK